MVLFTLSVFGLLLFLWIAFGGVTPLKPQGYRFKAAFPEAALLVNEADVRIAGVVVGKVKSKKLAESGRRVVATLELEDEFAPIPRDTRAILRQKSLLGETRSPRRSSSRSSSARSIPRPAGPSGSGCGRQGSRSAGTTRRTSTTRSATWPRSPRPAPTCSSRSTASGWRCAG
jgi:hypothetical protein